jgi:hypothetical protein
MFWPNLASCHYARTTQDWLKQQNIPYTGCLKICEFRIQSVVGKDPVELEKYLEKKIALPEEAL